MTWTSSSNASAVSLHEAIHLIVKALIFLFYHEMRFCNLEYKLILDNLRY